MYHQDVLAYSHFLDKIDHVGGSHIAMDLNLHFTRLSGLVAFRPVFPMLNEVSRVLLVHPERHACIPFVTGCRDFVSEPILGIMMTVFLGKSRIAFPPRRGVWMSGRLTEGVCIVSKILLWLMSTRWVRMRMRGFFELSYMRVVAVPTGVSADKVAT
jgi:hypothetical protein